MNFLELRRPWRQAHSLRDDSSPVGPVGCLDDSKNAKSNCLMGNYICMEDGNEFFHLASAVNIAPSFSTRNAVFC